MKHSSLSSIALAIAALNLVGCNGSETTIIEKEPTITPDPGHGHDEELPHGRLAISDSEQPLLYIYDLEENELIETINLTHPAEYLYSSPENRYAVAVHRSNDLVEFVDGGLWQELHGDHYDQHEDAPSLTSFTLTDVKPTHYVPRGETTAFFFDGDKDSGAVAGLSVLSDESISEGSIIAHHSFDTYMHGTAEIRGDFVLTTLRDANSESSLPEQVALLEMHGDHFHEEQVFEETCPALHGSFQTEDHIAFACGDGVLVIEQDGELFTASKLANPDTMPEGVRIGSLKGSPESPLMIGLSRGGVFLVDVDHGEITPFEWQPEEDITYLSYGFDGHNEHMLMLDNTGKLNLYAAEEGWQLEKRIEVFEEIAEDAKPLIIASKVDDLVYIVHEHEVLTVDLAEGAVIHDMHLDFEAGKAAWLGIAAEEEHDH